jgi:hypothetical protein
MEVKMSFFMGLMIINFLVLGANFCFLLVGGTPWKKGEETDPVQLGRRSYSVEIFSVGVTTSVLGVSWLVAWFYFLSTGWDSFIGQVNSLLLHVILQLAAALGLILAGVAIFRKWKSFKPIFFTSMGVLVGSLLMSLFFYGARGHGEPVFMYLIAAWTFAIGGILIIAVLLLDRMVHGEENTK